MYIELNGYEYFKTLFNKFLWISPNKCKIRYSVYHDKFIRQDGESMTSHYFLYPNHVVILQKAMSEKDLLGARTSPYPIAIQMSLISGNIKTSQNAKNLLGKLQALEAHEENRNTRQNSDRDEASRLPQYKPWVIETFSDVIF
jgi:hypothetical protein